MCHNHITRRRFLHASYHNQEISNYNPLQPRRDPKSNSTDGSSSCIVCRSEETKMRCERRVIFPSVHVMEDEDGKDTTANSDQKREEDATIDKLDDSTCPCNNSQRSTKYCQTYYPFSPHRKLSPLPSILKHNNTKYSEVQKKSVQIYSVPAAITNEDEDKSKETESTRSESLTSRTSSLRSRSSIMSEGEDDNSSNTTASIAFDPRVWICEFQRDEDEYEATWFTVDDLIRFKKEAIANIYRYHLEQLQQPILATSAEKSNNPSPSKPSSCITAPRTNRPSPPTTIRVGFSHPALKSDDNEFNY